MSDLRQYSKEFLMEFIDLYKEHPCLWQRKSKDYTNKMKKTAAYEVLVNKWREVEMDCDRETIVKKINSLRTCYRKELKKVHKSLKSGSKEVYKPTLWYFDLLHFLDDQTISRDFLSNLDEEDINDYLEVQDETPSTPNDSLNKSIRNPPTSVSRSLNTSSSKKKRKREEEENDAVFTLVGDRLTANREDDEFDLLARVYANKLRSIAKDQRIYAEKIINDTFFEAELGNLNRDCHLAITHE